MTETQPMDQDRIIRAAELREMLQRSQDTIARWVKSGRLPPPDVRLRGGCLRGCLQRGGVPARKCIRRLPVCAGAG